MDIVVRLRPSTMPVQSCVRRSLAGWHLSHCTKSGGEMTRCTEFRRAERSCGHRRTRPQPGDELVERQGRAEIISLQRANVQAVEHVCDHFALDTFRYARHAKVAGKLDYRTNDGQRVAGVRQVRNEAAVDLQRRER